MKSTIVWINWTERLQRSSRNLTFYFCRCLIMINVVVQNDDLQPNLVVNLDAEMSGGQGILQGQDHGQVP